MQLLPHLGMMVPTTGIHGRSVTGKSPRDHDDNDRFAAGIVLAVVISVAGCLPT